MAARIFQIIGIAALVIFILLVVLILPLISRLLKKANRSISANRSQIRMQMRSSLDEMETANVQIESIAMVTESLRQGLGVATRAADKAVNFLESNTFQIGFPVAIWVVVLFTSITRGLFGKRGQKQARQVVPIPPPSYETED